MCISGGENVRICYLNCNITKNLKQTLVICHVRRNNRKKIFHYYYIIIIIKFIIIIYVIMEIILKTIKTLATIKINQKYLFFYRLSVELLT